MSRVVHLNDGVTRAPGDRFQIAGVHAVFRQQGAQFLAVRADAPGMKDLHAGACQRDGLVEPFAAGKEVQPGGAVGLAGPVMCGTL